MIEVVTLVGGTVRDRGDAPDPEAALVAARQMRRDAADDGCHGPSIECLFYVNDKLVTGRKGAI